MKANSLQRSFKPRTLCPIPSPSFSALATLASCPRTCQTCCRFRAFALRVPSPGTTTLPGNSMGCLFTFFKFLLICHLNRDLLWPHCTKEYQLLFLPLLLHGTYHYLNLLIRFSVPWEDILPITKILSLMRALDLPCCNCCILQRLKSARPLSNLLSECAREPE